ncbi:hypothetical protein DFJ77DRAFT_467935 [Powellomyces hirtus]|nr:hypothetical protein DFJ77DRAFT_467935 [Powellomyces hirtus]
MTTPAPLSSHDCGIDFDIKMAVCPRGESARVLKSRPQTQAGTTRVVKAMFGKHGIHFVRVSKEPMRPTCSEITATNDLNCKKESVNHGGAQHEVTVDKSKITPVDPDNDQYATEKNSQGEFSCNAIVLRRIEDGHEGLKLHPWENVHDQPDAGETPEENEKDEEGGGGEEEEEEQEEEDKASRSESDHSHESSCSLSNRSPSPCPVPTSIPTALSCLLDHDFTAADLSGWSAEGAGELTAFHLVQRVDVSVMRAATATPDTGVRWRGANHSSCRPPQTAQPQYPQQYHPLSKGGYTTTTLWKSRKGSGGIDTDSATKSGRAETPTYRDGYLIDVNLPLRYNFIHPPLPSGGLGPGEVLEVPHETAPTGPVSGITQSTGTAITGSSTAHAFPFVEEQAKEASPAASQPSCGSPSNHEHAATQWRHQRVKAAMTMKELKKVFPPLMKQYSWKGRGTDTAKTVVRDEHQHSAVQREVNAIERPASRKSPPQKLRLRHGVATQNSTWQRLDAEFQAHGNNTVFHTQQLSLVPTSRLPHLNSDTKPISVTFIHPKPHKPGRRLGTSVSLPSLHSRATPRRRQTLRGLSDANGGASLSASLMLIRHAGLIYPHGAKKGESSFPTLV